jgi:hypothetical protein
MSTLYMLMFVGYGEELHTPNEDKHAKNWVSLQRYSIQHSEICSVLGTDPRRKEKKLPDNNEYQIEELINSAFKEEVIEAMDTSDNVLEIINALASNDHVWELAKENTSARILIISTVGALAMKFGDATSVLINEDMLDLSEDEEEEKETK